MIHCKLSGSAIMQLSPGSTENVTKNPEETSALAECSAHNYACSEFK